MHEQTSDSKMQLVGQGDLVHPGSCMVCGSGNYEKGYVNLGVWYEYEGNMYLCGNCLSEAGEIIGMLTAAEVTEMNALHAKIAQDNERLTSELEQANERLSVFDAAMRSIAVSSTDPGGPSSTGSLEITTPADAGKPVAKESVKGAKPQRTAKPKSGDFTEADPSEGTGEPSLL